MIADILFDLLYRMQLAVGYLIKIEAATQSISESDFEYFAITGVKSPANAIFDHTEMRFPQFNSKRVGLVVGVA